MAENDVSETMAFHGVKIAVPHISVGYDVIVRARKKVGLMKAERKKL